MTSTMKAWQYSSVSGGVEKNLQLKDDVPQPTITDNEILVQVHAMALNPVDYKATEAGLPLSLMGSMLIPGSDFCGKVAKTGRNINEYQIGEWVFGTKVGSLAKGSLAQYISVGKEMLAKLPEGVSVDDAAAIGIVGLTEYQSIAPNVQPGDKIFIHGGSGGTGVYGIQIAKALGCHVTTTCSTPNIDLCKSVGADEVIDYKTTDIITALSEKGQIFKLVVDNVSTPVELYKKSAAFLTPDGKFVQVGGSASLGSISQVATNLLLPSFLGGGKNKYQMILTKPSTDDLKLFGVWMKEGKIRGVLDQVFEWEDAVKAFEKLKTGRARGKIIIHVKQDKA